MLATLTGLLKGPTRKLKKSYNNEVYYYSDDDEDEGGCHVLKTHFKENMWAWLFFTPLSKIFAVFKNILLGFFFNNDKSI